MKKTFLMMIASLLLMAGSQDLRVLVMTPSPKMHCESCENKIKSNMRFEKGVKKVETNLKTQEVSITYDPKKISIWAGDQKGNITEACISVPVLIERLKNKVKRNFTQEEWNYYVGKSIPYRKIIK